MAKKKTAQSKKKSVKPESDDFEIDHNYRQELFCQEYAGGEFKGNATRSYLAAGYECTEEAARSSSCDLLANPNIIERIAELKESRLNRLKITGDSILGTIRKIAENDECKESDRLRASELLLKERGMLTEKVEHSGSVAGLTVVRRNHSDDEHAS